MTLRDSFCSITGTAAVTNPQSNTPTAFINFQLEIQTPKEGNQHLKVTHSAACDYRNEQKSVEIFGVAKETARLCSLGES